MDAFLRLYACLRLYDDKGDCCSCDDKGDCRKRHGSSDSNYSTISEAYSDEVDFGKTSPSEGYESEDENEYDDSYAEEEDDEDYSDEEETDEIVDRYEDDDLSQKNNMLPPPHELGDSNPFMLFLCLEMITSHKREILKRRFDFNELGIYFDRLVRKHRLAKVLPNAQARFREYLNMQWDVEEPGEVSQDED